MLTLVCFVVMVLFGIGAGVFTLIKILGGMRELQNATESGNLNVAKQALKSPSVELSQGLEADNFGGLVDDDGRINLRNYNRVVGQVLLVALNAQQQGTPESREHARALIASLQSSTGSIGDRLGDALGNTDNTRGIFDFLAHANVLQMLEKQSPGAQTAEFDTAYLKRGESTNVYLDPSILPSSTTVPEGALSSGSTDATGFQYLSGYRSFSIPGIGEIAGVPVFPGQRPHLVSNSVFEGGRDRPIPGVQLPPNSFKSAGTARESASRGMLKAISCSIVGALESKFTASIPRGYLVITNPAGSMDATPPPNPASILNNELFAGVFVANNGAFSTDRVLIEQWADYNNQPAPTGPEPSREGLFGDPRGIRSLGGDGYPSECDYTSLDGPGANAACQQLSGAFREAYGGQDRLPGVQSELTATEQMRANVWALFPSGGSIQVPSGFTGIRLFDYDQALPVAAGQPPVFTAAGTPIQILSQVGNGSGAELGIIDQVRQRIREIKPEANDEEIYALLTSRTIALGETLYIYLNGSQLQMTSAAPSWMVPGTVPDGLPSNITSSFQTIGLSVNPPMDAGFRNVVFGQMPNPSTFGLGQEEAIYTPSSGFNNLLGVLEFRSRINAGSDTGSDGGAAGEGN